MSPLFTLDTWRYTLLTRMDAMKSASREDASSIVGWISIACWIVVYSPQIYENYQLKSGEGLSVAFIVLWLAGDLANLAGGAMAHILPTMIILAVYVSKLNLASSLCRADCLYRIFVLQYSLCDIILLIQVYYYRGQKQRQLNRDGEPSETDRLLSARAEDERSDVKTEAGQPKSIIPSYLLLPLMLVFVAAVGVVAWYIQTAVVSDDPNAPQEPELPKGRIPENHVELEWKSQALGYASAVLYLGSRVPQIAHNYKTRCKGLSLSLFAMSVAGNVAYVASVLLKSTDRKYVIANASWLAGSGLTVFLDFVILGEFAYFQYEDRKLASMSSHADSEHHA